MNSGPPGGRPRRPQDCPATRTGPRCGQAPGTRALAKPPGPGSPRTWEVSPSTPPPPRWQLRDAASTRWPGTNGPVPLAPGRLLRLRTEDRASASKGRRSSRNLANQLKSFEELGLIRRDHARDAVIVTDPAGLRRLTETSLEPASGQYPGGDGP